MFNCECNHYYITDDKGEKCVPKNKVCSTSDGIVSPQAEREAGSECMNLLSDAVALAKACRTHCASICTCSHEYRTRNKQDPACEFCEIGKFVLPLADKILVGI